MPFDSKTPHGYIIGMLIQTVDVYSAASGGYLATCFLVCSCYLLKTIVLDISNDLSYLNVSELSAKNCIKMKALFFNIIRNITDAKQLSKILDSGMYQKAMQIFYFSYPKTAIYKFQSRFVREFGSIYEFAITIYFLWTLISISCSCLSLQLGLVE